MDTNAAGTERVLTRAAQFGRVPLSVLLAPGVTGDECRLYGYLTTFDFRRQGTAWPGRDRAATDLGWSVRTLARVMKALEARGAIEQRRTGPKVNVIHLLADIEDVPDLAYQGRLDVPDRVPEDVPDRADSGGRTSSRTRELERERARVLEEEFETWWSRYPRKHDKADAKKAYAEARKRGATAGDLLTARTNYTRTIERDGTEVRYVKHAKTFLNSDRWREYLTMPEQTKRRAVQSSIDPTDL